LVQKTIDETGLLLRSELALPECVEIAILQDAARREVAARQRVADAQTEEVVLESGGFTDEARLAARRMLLEMEVHVRVAGPCFRGNFERMQTLGGGKGMIEILVDALEAGDNRAAERRQSVENEKIGVAAGRELVIEEDIDAIGL